MGLKGIRCMHVMQYGSQLHGVVNAVMKVWNQLKASNISTDGRIVVPLEGLRFLFLSQVTATSFPRLSGDGLSAFSSRWWAFL
jgi:hypothetical protein